MGQELRPNDLTTELPHFQHGNRALASKVMKKTQGKLRYIHIYCLLHLPTVRSGDCIIFCGFGLLPSYYYLLKGGSLFGSLFFLSVSKICHKNI